jgi:site-specific DNA-methyltransferase (adenine-specific)
MSEGKKEILLGDCIELMRTFDAESIDLCVTDPPYKLTSGGSGGTLKIKYNTFEQTEKSRKQFFEIPPFYRWMDEVFRILKNTSHFYCMTNQMNLSQIILDGEKVGFKVLNILVWDKGMHTPLGYYMQNIEFVVLFRKGGAKKINNMGSTALVSIKGIRGNKIHPSEKPVELYDHFILNSSKEKDICIDPFGGSGTIIESCLKNSRQFIAIEKDPNHFEKMKKRGDFNKNFEPQTLFGNEM